MGRRESYCRWLKKINWALLAGWTDVEDTQRWAGGEGRMSKVSVTLSVAL